MCIRQKIHTSTYRVASLDSKTTHTGGTESRAGKLSGSCGLGVKFIT